MSRLFDWLLGRCRDELRAGDEVIYTYGYDFDEHLRHFGTVIDPLPDSENVEVRFTELIDPDRPKIRVPVIETENLFRRRDDLRHYPSCPRR